MVLTAPFQTLEPQSRQNLNVDAYAAAALGMSRLAAMTLPCALDVHYGAEPQQKLDIYMPPGQGPNPGKGLPVCIQLHGGGSDHGYKEWMGLNAPAITAFPAIMVAVQYKLAPLDQYPVHLNDCLLATKWVHDHIAQYGGDPNRIFVAGHSAGAHLAALVALRRDRYAEFGLPQGVIKGCAPTSGTYDYRDVEMYGESPDKGRHRQDSAQLIRDLSSILFIEGNQVPFFVTWGEKDTDYAKTQGAVFVLELRRQKAPADGHEYPAFNHFWMHVDQARPENRTTRKLKAWMTGA